MQSRRYGPHCHFGGFVVTLHVKKRGSNECSKNVIQDIMTHYYTYFYLPDKNIYIYTLMKGIKY